MQNVLKVIHITLHKIAQKIFKKFVKIFADIFKINLGLFLGDKSKLQKMVQMAWTFVNDRYLLNIDTILNI